MHEDHAQVESGVAGITPPDSQRPGERRSRPAARGFRQEVWDHDLAMHAGERARHWLAEDLGHEADWTSVGLIPAAASASLQVVSRDAGVIAGLPLAELICELVDEELTLRPLVAEGASVAAGTPVARLAGPVRDVLVAERTLLNALGRMSGVASAVRRLVDAVAGTGCDVYDTRKTVPGWRRLDKYAVRIGGGCNHRGGLFDAILIKDNHLAELAAEGCGPDEAVRRARAFVAATFPRQRVEAMVVEIEVDSLEQLAAVLPAEPDVVLLDNMLPATLRAAVAMRDAACPGVILEASGGISFETVREIAETGVDRLSTGWPTHDAPWLDLGLDWD
jgi:nicotinate-nucleotide pyrophosphorylase (carboxylating)